MGGAMGGVRDESQGVVAELDRLDAWIGETEHFGEESRSRLLVAASLLHVADAVRAVARSVRVSQDGVMAGGVGVWVSLPAEDWALVTAALGEIHGRMEARAAITRRLLRSMGSIRRQVQSPIEARGAHWEGTRAMGVEISDAHVQALFDELTVDEEVGGEPCATRRVLDPRALAHWCAKIEARLDEAERTVRQGYSVPNVAQGLEE